MNSSFETTARSFAPGIGEAVAHRTVSRKKADGSIETWEDVAYRVALGNTLLSPNDSGLEFESLHHHLRQASVLMSGRHLQHGDETQPTRNQEVFTNCSTSASSFILFYLLLNGSGVGRCYDDDMMVVDWSRDMPYVLPVIRGDHPDVLSGEIGQGYVDPVFPDEFSGQIVFEVPDSREGWAKAIEQIERITWQADSANKVLLLDFSGVRHRGQPIGGMQGRPASGPGPLMDAIRNIAAVKSSDMAPWKATMYVDHYLAECVLVGGARRAARMATKTWRDKSVLDFITVKQGGVLWSSNNSVCVDEDFWEWNKQPLAFWDQELRSYRAYMEAEHAHKVLESIASSSYHHGTGEPGIITVSKLTAKDHGIEVLFDGDYAESERFKLDDATKIMTAQLATIVAKKEHMMIVNPCGEIALVLLGAYCVIADVVPFHASSDDDAESAFRAAVRALIRTNTMDCLYSKEVARTNRIGVGMTGLHSYAWARFGFGWKDLVDEKKSIAFWRMLSRFSNAVVDEGVIYSKKLGRNIPHTMTTMKPAGTTSKLFGLEEGAHLPSMREYLRWVQFRNGDPLIEEYRAKGYPVRELQIYAGTTIVGFPTVPTICTLGMGDKLITAAEATPEEQYEYLRLLEKWWIDGYDEKRDSRHSYGNQVSYTLKYDPKEVSYEHFRQTLLDGQSTVKCCSVMPQVDTTAYEYQPEEPVTAERFKEIVANIKDAAVTQDIGFEHLDCSGGACPIDFSAQKVA